MAALGIESRRESAPIPGQFPKLKTLHVWWARRPLVASAAVVLGGLLPTWSPDLAARYPDATELSDEKSYRAWFFRLVGIWGDPVHAKRLADAAKASGVKMPANPYSYKPAFRNSPSGGDLDLLHRILIDTWGEMPTVADPTAGGGSIPFASVRLGLPTIANDLNGVAAGILKASIEIPATKGSSAVPTIREKGRALVERVGDRVRKYFPEAEGETITNYLFANAVACPRTGRIVPLMPDKWLCKDKGKEAAIRIVTSSDDGDMLQVPKFQVVTGSAVDAKDASSGTMNRGKAVSPYDNLVIDGAYIKEEAQAGRMTWLLYAVVTRTASGKRHFRAPTELDAEGLRQAESDYATQRPLWEAAGLVPTEAFPEGNDMRPRNYGLDRWLDFFTPRQALVHGVFAEEFAALVSEMQAGDQHDSDDLLFLLAVMQGKALNWCSRLSSWDVSRQKTRSVFDRHDFAFKSTFAEFEGSHELYPWCLDQLLDGYTEIAKLVESTGQADLSTASPVRRSVRVTQGSAAQLPSVPDGSVAHICMDPPYYDNVMYAELADYFYVWERLTMGRIQPQFFSLALCDKDNEAVANLARFAAMGKRKQELADLDYESKMTAIFRECHRMLRDDGVLTVMFTHKRAEAWDTLGMGLLQAGFTVEASWPVNTESEQSLHQANMNSAASTVMLVCRKRRALAGEKVFLEDIESDVRNAAKSAAEDFHRDGIAGVDLLLSTYGPALSVISSHWPVFSAEADEDGRARLLRPDEALSIAREEVVRLTRQRIVGRDVQIDNHSDFVLIAWETFKAYEFGFDEARRLALSVGALNIDELAQSKVLEKKSGTVRLLSPKERIRRGGDDSSTGVRIDASKFDYMNDALDTVLYVAAVDGMSEAKVFMDRLGLTSDQRFLAYVQGLVNAMPRVMAKGEWIVPEAGLLDTLVTAHLPDITLPAEPEVVVEVQEAPTLFD